ncbi:Mks condensin complex protein MksE [Pseudomonas sp. DP-17]|uniref:Mks condensin complex protein MksE n=1 Tax=Pseudomonas sp. DP-17 TaxID=1580486 RepID=UPI001EFC1045|nr:Mks condensin complex protein MksE [Pseudomonas sp. DP-17]MCG8911414.1 chromosome partitioning protein [Pseudomonas sp. DP-17]
MQINLTEMTQLAPIFRELFKGFHISRRDPELYSQLSNQQDAYRALFRSLGYELVCDTRGFYYFVPEQIGAQVNKTAQRLALFTFILVEHLADQGRDPLAVLDGGSIGRDELPPLLEKYRDLFLQAEVTTQEELEEKVMRRLTQLGFAAEDNGVYRFLPPIHRFLDVCLSVQQDRDLASNLHASEMQFSAPVLMEEDDEPVVILESYAEEPAADSEDAIMVIDEPTSVADAVKPEPAEEESEEDALARAIAEEQEAQA